MASQDCTNNDKVIQGFGKRERKNSDSDEDFEQVVSARKIQSLYCPFCSINFSTIDGLMKHLLNRVGSHQKKVNLSKSNELSITKEKNLPTCSATLPPSQPINLPSRSLGAVEDHANHLQDGDAGKQLTRSEESESGRDNRENGKICSRQFSRKKKSDRRIPTQIVTKPHKCQTCLKSFVHRGNLNVHIRTHTGERPYRCQLCSKSFGQLGSLNSHIQTHTGERPHKCQLCLKSYGQLAYLRSHLRTHADSVQN